MEKKRALRQTLGCLLAVLGTVVLLAGGAGWLFYQVFGGLAASNTVVQTVKSPDGNCCAVVIDSDQGALGGATIVEVSEVLFRLGSLAVKKPARRVYTGPWGVADSLTVAWREDGCLLIDGELYPIE